jgi:hypothetical protein
VRVIRLHVHPLCFVKKIIYLLAVLPMLICAAQAPAQTSGDTMSGKAGLVVAESAGSAERLSAYQRAGDWQQFAELFEATIKKISPKYGEHIFADAVGVRIGGDSWALNSRAWDVFKKCDDKAVLRNALSWSELSIRVARPITHPETEAYPIQSLDKKANLLYKLGRVDEAIAVELAAITQVVAASGAKGALFDEYNAALEKIRQGEPTWPAK